MSHEQAERRPEPSAFPFTEHERLFETLTDRRFQAIVFDQETTIHNVKVSTNSFGEFLFITLSRGGAEGTVTLNFYGLGFHEPREQWITDQWRWYESSTQHSSSNRDISLDSVRAQLAERKQFVQTEAKTSEPQSKRGQLYELLADLTDEDGALTDLEDMGWWLLGEDE